jgi:ribosomal protein S18 acetylase RimI-like enzyme
MTVSVRPVRDDEYPAWLERVKAGYTASMIDEGGVDEETARTKSEHDHAALLIDGPATEGQHLFVVEDDGEVIGSLWLADRSDDLGRTMFVYAVGIDEAFRGRGAGRAAMEFAEDVARERGHSSITLNVFGGNDVARGLYRSLGYSEQAVLMKKDL